MKTVKVTSIVTGSIPIIGWLISIPYNWWALGTPFTATGEWNNLPLWFLTMPLLKIADLLFDKYWFPENRYVLILTYTVICTIIYAAIGAMVPLSLRYVVSKLKKS